MLTPISKSIFCLLFLLMLASCDGRKKNNQSELCRDFVEVSFSDLLDNPAAYHNKTLRVRGYFYAGREEFAIYRTKKIFNFDAGIWVNFDRKLKFYENDKYEDWVGDKMTLIGVFNVEETGHLNQYLGTLHVKCFE